MYLSKGHMTYTAAMAGLQLLLGLPLTLMLLLAGLADPDVFLDDFPETLPLLLEFTFIAWLGIGNVRRFLHACRFNRMFTELGIGSVTVGQAAQKLGIGVVTCQNRFDHLSRMGLLKHCHFECEHEARFVLHKKRGDDHRGIFIVVLQMIVFFGIGIGGFMLFLFGFGLLNEMLSGDLLYMDELGIILGIALFFVGMMAVSLKIRKTIGLAYRFSNYLSGNAGRAVPAVQAARAFAKNEATVVRDFSRLKAFGLLTGWTLCNVPAPQFLPNTMAMQPQAAPRPQPAPPQAKPEYHAVNCPNCAASLVLEVGKVEQCPYCDSWLEVQDE